MVQSSHFAILNSLNFRSTECIVEEKQRGLDRYTHCCGRGALGAVALGALGVGELSELRVQPEHAGDHLAHRRVGDVWGERANLDVGGELLPVDLEEADSSEQARSKHSAEAQYVVVLAQAAHHLCVRALECVPAKDGRRWACVVIVGFGVRAIGLGHTTKAARPCDSRR